MSRKEHVDCWFQQNEYNAIHNEIDETLQIIEREHKKFGRTYSNHNRHESQATDEIDATSSHTSEDAIIKGDICLRGLECHLEHQNRRRRFYRTLAYEKVFDEQEDQWYYGIYDDVSIARAYFKVTRKCRFRSEIRALRDRREIEDYTFQERMKLSIHPDNAQDLRYRFEVFGVEKSARKPPTEATEGKLYRKRRRSNTWGDQRLKPCLKQAMR